MRVEKDKEVTVLEVEIEVDMNIYNKEPEHYQMTETGQDIGLG